MGTKFHNIFILLHEAIPTSKKVDKTSPKNLWIIWLSLLIRLPIIFTLSDQNKQFCWNEPTSKQSCNVRSQSKARNLYNVPQVGMICIRKGWDAKCSAYWCKFWILVSFRVFWAKHHHTKLQRSYLGLHTKKWYII